MNYQIKPCKFLKRGLLLFLLAILVWSCENDEVLESVNQEEHTYKTVSKSQAQNVFNSFQKKREKIISKSLKSKNSFLEISPNWNSFKEENLSFTDALLSTTDIKTNALTKLTSRLIFLNVDDKVLRVIESKQSIKQVGNKVVDGFVYYHNLDGKFITGYKLENSIVTKQLVKKGNISKASFFSLMSFFTTECEEDLVPNSNFCNDSLDEVIITGTTGSVETEASPVYYFFGGGSSDGDYDPYGDYSGYSEGGGGSGDGNNEQDNSCTDGRVYNYINGNCECPFGYTDINGSCVEDIQILNELTGKADCVYQKLQDQSISFKEMIQKFDGDFPVSHLKLRSSYSLPNNINGKTYPPSDYIITIDINNNKLNRPNLSIARTIIHETIHAEMFRKIMSILDNGGDLNGLTKSEWTQKLSKGDYPGIFDYYSRYGVNDMQHQQMAAHYVSTISNYLSEFQSGLSPNIYNSLAWTGLKNTQAWKELKSDTLNINNTIRNFNSTGSEICY